MINIIAPGTVGITLTAVGLALLARSRDTAQWRRITGTVVEVAIQTTRGGPDSNHDTVFYYSELHYKYVFNGVVRRGSRNLSGSVTSRASAVRLGRQYIPGHAIAVFVDERNPHKHALERGMNHGYWVFVVMGLAWIGVAISFWLD